MIIGLFDAAADTIYDMPLKGFSSMGGGLCYYDASKTNAILYTVGTLAGSFAAMQGALADLFSTTKSEFARLQAEIADIQNKLHAATSAGIFEAGADFLFDISLETLFYVPLENVGIGTNNNVTSCQCDAGKITEIHSDVTAIKNKFPTTGTVPTVDNLTAARDKILEKLPLLDGLRAASTADVATAVTTITFYGDTSWKTAVGFATPGDVKLTATTQTVDLSTVEGTLNAVKSKVDTLPESFVEVVTKTVEVTQETVNVVTQTVDLSGVTQTLGQIKTQTDKIPNAPAAVGNIPSATDITAAVGRRQIVNNPPLLSVDGLVLAALSSVTEPSAGNPTTGTLRVKNPDGSTLGTFTLGVEPASSAKVITGVNP